jgi:hypothetical protein
MVGRDLAEKLGAFGKNFQLIINKTSEFHFQFWLGRLSTINNLTIK